MKSFLELVEETEKTHKPVVMAFGRMNPPTTGHLKLIHKVMDTAKKFNAPHHIIVSHTQDSKKNPLSDAQKVKHLKRYEPKANIRSSSKQSPNFLTHAEALHKMGHDHLIYVAGSDRVKEVHGLLHKYNGTHKGALFNFKKIQVVSAGHRDPDAEGAEGMSGTKMREHAKNKDFSSFRQGVPHHVSDEHAKELMHDVRKGMGLNEEHNRGMFKAIFITGGPNSGKDVVIREAIASSTITELNLIQAKEYLVDKQKLSEKSSDYRRESIRNRGPLIINGPADDYEKITYIKEELEELGYQTMMVFVNTTNEASRERNSMLSRMMAESVRHDKWLKSQQVTRQYQELYNNFMVFDNTGELSDKEFDIHEIYENSKEFLDSKIINETAVDWMQRNKKLDINYTINRLFGEDSDKKTNRFLKIKTTPGFKADGPADSVPDNRTKTDSDSISGNQRPRKDPNGRGHSGGAWSGAYSTEETKFKTFEGSNPTIKIRPEPKESNFSQDNDKTKKKKNGDNSGKEVKKVNVSGLGSEWNTRTNGSGLTGGAGLGNQTYSESEMYSNANPATTAVPSGGSVNPLTSAYDEKPKPVKYRKKSLKEFQGFINGPESGVGGTLGGASNKEPMETYGDKSRNGIVIDKKNKKKLKEDHVKELEGGLMKLTSHSYDSIDRLMKMIAKKHGITGKDLHDDFKDKHGKIPDAWIKEIK